jgi:site-specific DNA recombinase
MLQNRVYRGEIVHKEAAFPGEHAPTVDEDLWRQVQEKLQANGVERRGARDEAKLVYLLPGVLFDAEGRLMTPTHAIKKGVRYRYYVSRRLITEVKGGHKHDPGAGQRLPAVELERLIVERLKIFFADADAIAALSPGVRSAPNIKRAIAAASDIVRAIETEGEMRTFDLLRPLIVRAQVYLDRVEVDLGAAQVAAAFLGNGSSIETRLGDRLGDNQEADNAPSAAADDGRLIRLTIAAELKRAGKEMKFILPGADNNSSVDDALVRLLIRAHALACRLAMSPGSNLEDIGAQESMGAPYAARLMRLNYLAPDIVTAIFNGRQPVGLMASKLMVDTRLPLAWEEQRKTLGFA